jgi:hypothetical protein
MTFLLCMIFFVGAYESYLPIYAQSHFKQIENPYNRNQTLDLTVNLLSRSFSAQTDVVAFAKIEPDRLDISHDRLKNISIPTDYHIAFEGTTCAHVGDTYDRIYPCWIRLDNSTNSEPYDMKYTGNKTIVFSHGGTFDVLLYHEDLDIANATSIGRAFIQIEPLQSTTSLILFRVVAIIGISAGAIGFLNWYWRYREHVLGH